MELEWHQAMGISRPRVERPTDSSILWDMVPVNSTSRSGLPRSWAPRLNLG